MIRFRTINVDEKELIEYLKKNLKVKQEVIEHYHDMAYDGKYMYTKIYLGNELIASKSQEIK